MAEQILASTSPQPLPMAVSGAANDQQNPVQPSTTSVPEHLLYKNRLQEYTQKSSLPLPVYEVVNEGFQHAPLFKATVWVDGTSYTSPNGFAHRKSAEQNVAKIALDDIMQKKKDIVCTMQKKKDIVCPINHEDLVFCKSIMNEYAAKLHLEMPTYETASPQGAGFLSSLVFNGVTYTGQVAGSKKEAEQLAARAAILSIIESPNSSTDIITGIIKAKQKRHAAMNHVNASNNNDNAAYNVTSFMPLVHSVDPTLGLDLSKGKEIDDNGAMNNVSSADIEKSSSQVSHIPIENTLVHEFKKPKLDTSPVPVNPMIVFVPPGAGSSTGKKRRKKGKKIHRPVAQFSCNMDPINQVPCSISQ